MSLHNDDDLQRAKDALAANGVPQALSNAHLVLDAVLPAYTARVLREAADYLDKQEPTGGACICAVAPCPR